MIVCVLAIDETDEWGVDEHRASDRSGAELHWKLDHGCLSVVETRPVGGITHCRVLTSYGVGAWRQVWKQ